MIREQAMSAGLFGSRSEMFAQAPVEPLHHPIGLGMEGAREFVDDALLCTEAINGCWPEGRS